jgi:hypothetical protein
MKITHRAHRDKWEISHKSASKQDSVEPSFTHNPSACVGPPFQSTKKVSLRHVQLCII